MGFEQLAALRDQLALEAKKNAPAEAERPARSERQGHAQKRAKHGGAGSDPVRQDGQAAAKPREKTPSGERDKRQQGARGKPRQHDGRGGNARPQDSRAGNPRPPRQAEPIDPVLMSISRLQRKFPVTFPKSPAPKLPLKLGIHKDLIGHAEELGLDEAAIRLAVKTWCEGRRYWACMEEGAARINLEGQPDGAVTKEEALRAKRLASRAVHKAIVARKDAAKRAAGEQAPAAVAAESAADAPVPEATPAVAEPVSDVPVASTDVLSSDQ